MMLTKTVTPKQTLEAASSLASFTGSVFGFRSPSICDLDMKLDKILVKLREISEIVRNIGHLVQCTQIKQNYRELSTKITSLLNIYDAFYRVKNRIGKENITPMKLDYNMIGKSRPDMKTDKRKFIYYDSGAYTFVNFAAWMVWKHETAKPNLANTVLTFEPGLEKVITKYNTRLSGHYKQYTEDDDYQCFQACKHEDQCAAATFYAPFVRNCFFLGKDFTKSMKSGWIAYIKDKVPTNNDQYEVNYMDDKIIDETVHTDASEGKYVGRWADDMMRGQGVRVSVDVAVWMCIATITLMVWS
ncbi:hypothetical protein I4U23_005425 [Adineta vaga]|nr:hypothetical protein I4U23_005425 [Adineta vaga]